MRDYVPPLQSDDTWPPSAWRTPEVTPTSFLRRRRGQFRRLLGCVIVGAALSAAFALCARWLLLWGMQ